MVRRKTIKKYLKQKKISTRKIAAVAGVSHPTVVRVLNGQSNSYPAMEAISKLLNIPFQDLWEKEFGDLYRHINRLLGVNHESNCA